MVNKFVDWLCSRNVAGVLALVNGVFCVNSMWNASYMWAAVSGLFAVLCARSYFRRQF